jgi:hypothetical protein
MRRYIVRNLINLIEKIIMFLRFFSSFVLLAFGIFLMSPIVAIASKGSDIIVMTASIWDSCTTSVVCEQTSDTSYQCHSTSMMMTGLSGQVHQISVGKTAPGVLPYARYREMDRVSCPRGMQSSYIGPDTFVYPFVRITKIQV